MVKSISLTTYGGKLKMNTDNNTIKIDISKVDLEMLFTVVLDITDDLYRQAVPQTVQKRRGVKPQLSDSEVITISLVGEMLTDSETAWVNFVAKNYLCLFPKLNERSRFHRRNKDLWLVKNLIRQQMLEKLNTAFERYHIIDSLPVPICKYVRSIRCRLFLGEGEAAIEKDSLFGVAESKKEKIYGFKLHLLVTIDGIVVNFVLAPARHHDVNLATEVMENYQNLTVGGDKGYVSQALQEDMRLNQQIQLITRKRQNQKEQNTTSEKWFLAKFRKIIETVNSSLTEQFHIAKIRARTLWGLFSKIISKITSFTLGIYFNKLSGRSLLEIKAIAF
jgi:IS5 family transposase